MRVPRRWTVAWAAILLVTSGLAVGHAATPSRVTGTATYREPIALPPQARFEATIEDVSRAGGPSQVVGRVLMEKVGQPPIRFTIEVNKKQIVASHRYVMRATIRNRDQLLFVSEQPVPVLTQGHGSDIVLLILVPRGGHKPTLAPLPASFIGMLPCADCLGIQYSINVFEDGAYVQRVTYLRSGHDESFYEIGAWSLSSDQHTVILNSAESTAYWSLQDSDTLRKLDKEGRPIVSRLPYDLTRASQLQPMEPRVRLRGLFQYVSDAARFSDCLSGLQWPVSQDDDFPDLERAYAAHKKKKKAGADLLVSLDGRIGMLPAFPGSPPEPTLVVERFIGALPSEICQQGVVQLDLPNNRWRPTVVAGKPVVVAPKQHEPWIVLDAKSSKVSGLAGCNRVSGSYRAGSDGQLKFSNLAATKMACPQSQVERAFLDALQRTKSYRIVGRNLELFGANGAMVARLEERNL